MAMINNRTVCIIALIVHALVFIDGAPTSDIKARVTRPAGELEKKLTAGLGSESVAAVTSDKLLVSNDAPTGKTGPIEAKQFTAASGRLKVSIPSGGQKLSRIDGERVAAETGRRRRHVSKDDDKIPADKGIPWDTMKLVHGDDEERPTTPEATIKTMIIDGQVVVFEEELITIPSVSAAMAESSV